MNNLIEIDKDFFDHLLNCMANQRFIHEQETSVQKDWQAIIDKAYHDARKLQYVPTEEN